MATSQSSSPSSWFSHHLEPTASHLTYLLISSFLLLYALLSSPIRNTLHLSEPPLATLLGIAFGPRGASFLDPTRWGFEDNVTQEATRVIVGLQVFSVGVELPKKYFSRNRYTHATSVAILLGPVMAFSWLATAGLVYGVLGTKFTTALIVSACLAPTDPVLSASVLAESRFANRVPSRIRHMLSAESGCNDGVSFPFLYIGINLVVQGSLGGAVKEWFLGTILWQCVLGTALGLAIGKGFNFALKLSTRSQNIDPPAFLVFYLLLALFSVGVGSSLGVDDFLVAFGAGYGFAYDGWFASKTRATHLPQILDLLLNSTMFIYFGTVIPWHFIESSSTNGDGRTDLGAVVTANINPTRLTVLLLLILLFRRIPIVLACKRLIPDILTWHEALFVGHFGPMGLGALFLAIEARAMLENGTGMPDTHPDPDAKHLEAIQAIWTIVCFVILGSVLVHGFSVVVISVGASLTRRKGERAPLLGQEEDRLVGMVHPGSGDESTVSGLSEEEDRAE